MGIASLPSTFAMSLLGFTSLLLIAACILTLREYSQKAFNYSPGTAITLVSWVAYVVGFVVPAIIWNVDAACIVCSFIFLFWTAYYTSRTSLLTGLAYALLAPTSLIVMGGMGFGGTLMQSSLEYEPRTGEPSD